MSGPFVPYSGRLDRLVIWGFGVEGRAARDWARAVAPDAEITVIDAAGDQAGGDLPVFAENAAEAAAAVARADLVIRSAGVPPTKPPLLNAARTPGRVRTGMDLWFDAADPARVIGVTGTKGKSTTVGMIHAILTAGGVTSVLAGNVGRAMLATPLPKAGGAAVVEISSYQACDLNAGPGAMGLTSLHRDHLPWHGGEDAYRAAKFRPFALPSCRVRVSTPETAAFFDDAGASVTVADHALLPDNAPSAPEVRSNAAVAMTLIREAGFLTAQALADAAETVFAEWRPPDHRRAVLGRRGGALWVDDALATIPEATAAALAAHPEGSMILLLGGAERDQAFAPLIEAIRKRGNVRCLLSGSVGPRLERALRQAGTAASVERRIDFAGALALIDPEGPGVETVLFSPAAASDPPETHRTRAAAFAEHAALKSKF